MIAVIFEAVPKEGKTGEYVDIAASLKDELCKVPGFISIERFQSFADPGKVLSLSIWKDEAAVAQWRNVELHRMAQAAGRDHIFEDDHLNIAEITRSYGMHDRAGAPADSNNIHQR